MHRALPIHMHTYMYRYTVNTHALTMTLHVKPHMTGTADSFERVFSVRLTYKWKVPQVIYNYVHPSHTCTTPSHTCTTPSHTTPITCTYTVHMYMYMYRCITCIYQTEVASSPGHQLKFGKKTTWSPLQL